MAISGGDGSIILTTKVDTSGISKGSLSIRSALQGVDNIVKKVQNSFSAFREQKVTLATLNQAIKDQTYVLKSLENEHAKLVATGKGSSAQAKQLKGDIDALTVELKEMEGAAATLGAKGSTSINKIGTAMKTLLSYFIGIQTIFKVINFSGEAAEFATQTEASVQRLIDIYGEAAQSVGDFIDANARAIGMSRSAGASIASTYGNLLSVWADQETNAQLTNNLLNQTAVIASKTGRTTTDVAERIRSGLLGNTEAIEDLGVNVNIKTIEITDAFKRIADGRSWEQLNAYEQSQVRTLAILEQSTNKYGTTVAETTATVRNQYQAAYEDFQNTWGQVVNTVLIPVLKILTQVFTIATKGLQVMAGLSGKTVENSGQTSSNIKQQTKEQEKLNKALKKGLASFDEINILTEQSAENTAGAGTGTQISGIGGVGANYDNSFVEKIDADLAAIMGYVGFALVAIGVLLICFGHIGWGIGFIIAGAAIFSVSQAALSEGAELEKVKNIMNGIISGISLLALVLGIILVATGGSLPLGIGLIIIGAAGLATEVALNWNAITTAISNFFTNNAGLVVGISLALLVLGIILLITGVGIPLGIGLVVAGAAGLVTEVVLNWNYITETITNFFQKNAGLIVGVSIALIVLGIILLFTGVGIPLAIGLIVAGGGALAATVALNWNFIVDKVKEVWQKVKNFWNSYIAPIFTAKWWADLGKKAINGLLGVIETGLNWIIKKINEFIGGISGIVGAVGKVIGQDWSIGKIPNVKIPRLAQGAVIPPNREFLAVLGDNKKENEIVSPVSTMKQAFMEAMVEMGSTGQTVKEEHYYLSETELMTILHKLVKGGERLQGPSLISGGAY